jgi:tryptophan-rich sensory protein
MSYLYLKQPTQRVIGLFVIQWLLNVSWNYVFFNQHLVGLGLAIIATLTSVVGIFFFNFKTDLKVKRLLILPYLIWLCIATSLNAYILVYN